MRSPRDDAALSEIRVEIIYIIYTLLVAQWAGAILVDKMPALMVLNEQAVPSIYWEPRQPRLKRQELALDLKGGAEVAGATLSNSEPVLSVRTR